MTRGEEDPRSSHPGSTPEPGVPPWVRCRFGYLCRVSVQDTWTPHCALSRSGPSRPCRRSSAMVHTPVVQHFQGRSYKDGNGVVSMSKGARASVSLCFSFPTPPTQPPHTPTAGPRHHEAHPRDPPKTLPSTVPVPPGSRPRPRAWYRAVQQAVQRQGSPCTLGGIQVERPPHHPHHPT